MDTVKKLRSGQRSQATKLLKQLEEFKEGPDYHINLRTLKIQLEEKREELKLLDKQVCAAITSEADIESDIQAAEKYQFNLIQGIEKISLCLQKKKTQDCSIKESGNSAELPNEECLAKLPKIEMMKFNGKVMDWMPFWQSYEATIDQRSNLSKVQKLNYLISLLTGEAAKAVSGFALIAENYEDVINVLKERYGNTEIIQDYHIRQILNLKPIKQMNDIKGLSNLLNEISTNLRSLKNLNISSSRCSEILNVKIKELIPEEMQIQYERQRTEGVCSTEQLMKFLHKEVQILEKIKTPTTLDPNARAFEPRKQVYRPSQFYTPRAMLHGARPERFSRTFNTYPRAPTPNFNRFVRPERFVRPPNGETVGRGHRAI